jgi:6-phosphogluconolactonase
MRSIGAYFNAFQTALSPRSVTVDPTGRFVYVACGSSVSEYSIDPTTGGLSPIPGSPFQAGNTPYSVTVAPSGKFAYVANGSGSDILAYQSIRQVGR